MAPRRSSRDAHRRAARAPAHGPGTFLTRRSPPSSRVPATWPRTFFTPCSTAERPRSRGMAPRRSSRDAQRRAAAFPATWPRTFLTRRSTPSGSVSRGIAPRCSGTGWSVGAAPCWAESPSRLSSQCSTPAPTPPEGTRGCVDLHGLASARGCPVDHIRGLLADHVRRHDDEETGNLGEHRRVHHPQALHAAHPERRVDPAFGSVSPPILHVHEAWWPQARSWMNPSMPASVPRSRRPP